MPQTDYSVDMPASRPGLLTDDVNVRTAGKRSDEAIPFGRLVCFDTEDDLVKLPSEASDVTNKGAVQGVALSVFTMENTNNGLAPAHAIGDNFDVVRRGRVGVRVEQAVTPASPVFVRFTGSPISGQSQALVLVNETTPDTERVLTSGQCKISFKGVKTAFLASNADSATIQAALEAISTVGVGNVLVSGIFEDNDVVLTFIGALEGEDQPLCLLTDCTLGWERDQIVDVEVDDNSPDDFTITINGVDFPHPSTGTPAVAQVNDLVVLNNTPAAFTVTINGTPFTFTPTVETIEQIRDALIAAINGGAEPVTATPVSTDGITLTADVAGTAFTLAVTANISNTATTPNSPLIPETANSIRDELIILVNAGAEPVTATSGGAGIVTLTADVPGTAFTFAASANMTATENQANGNDDFSGTFEESGDAIVSPELLGEARGLFRTDEDDQGDGATAAALAGARFATSAPAGGVAVLDLDV